MRSLRARDLNVDYSCKNDVDSSLGNGKSYDAVKSAKVPTKESAEPTKPAKHEQSQGKENTRRMSGEGTLKSKALSEQPKPASAKPADAPKPTNKRKSISPKSEKVSPKESTKPKKASKSPEDTEKAQRAKPSPKESTAPPSSSPAAEPTKQNKRKKKGAKESLSPVGSPVIASAVSSLFSLAAPSLPESPPIQKLPSPPAASKITEEKAQAAKKKRARDPSDSIDTSKDSSASKKVHQIKQSFATEQKLLSLLDEKDKKYTELQKRLDAAQESHEQQTAALIAELQKDAESKSKASDDLIEHQKKEIARLKKRIQGATGTNVDEEEQKMAKQNQQLSDNNEVLKGEVIQLHKKWTSAQRKFEEAASEAKALRAELQAALQAKEEAIQLAARAAESLGQSDPSAKAAATPARGEEADFENTRVIEAYQMMFATRVTMNPNGSAHCKTVNRKAGRVVEFDMVLGDEEVEYLPTRLDVGDAPLPEYMRDSISFRPVDTAEFMKNMMVAVFHKGQGSAQ